jgi:hypothetical protein
MWLRSREVTANVRRFEPHPRGPSQDRCSREMTAVASSASFAPTRGWSKAQVSGLRLRSGQVRSELTNIKLSEIGAAVACHEQLRSELANKATNASRQLGDSVRVGVRRRSESMTAHAVGGR